MNDTSTLQTPSATPPEKQERQWVFEQPDTDWLIASQIDMVEISKAEEPLHVTLFLPGTIITGAIISAEEYMNRNGLNALWEMLNPSKNERVAFERREYIHLKDARFFLNANELTSTVQSGILWRGKLSSVVGFCFGAVSGTANT